MLSKGFTQVPNYITDNFVPKLTLAELKILLVVLRQTIGWTNKKTGKRKLRDRLTCKMFQRKTGLCKRAVVNGVKSLVTQNLITVTDFQGKELKLPKERKGKLYLYFALASSAHFVTARSAAKYPVPVPQRPHNNRNWPKKNDTKESNEDFQQIGEAIRKRFNQIPGYKS